MTSTVSKESLDKQIGDLNALLDMVAEDWDEHPLIRGDTIWFAKLVNKTIKLRDDLVKERRELDV